MRKGKKLEPGVETSLICIFMGSVTSFWVEYLETGMFASTAANSMGASDNYARIWATLNFSSHPFLLSSSDKVLFVFQAISFSFILYLSP